jgi:prepilin-type N-terminal cleavage/methylation domain-containing protein
MTRRVGFTLLELMVAIVVTSVVALLAYGTARAGYDTNERVERYRTNVEAQAVVRELVLDALRHPVEGGGSAMNDVLFTIEDATSPEGLPMDRVRFLSQGMTPPLGASATWSVTLAASHDGVHLLAVPVGAGEEAAPMDARLTSARGLNVRVLDRTADSVWRDRWDVAGRVPAAVVLEFFSERGTLVAPPLVVHAALESVK